LRPSVGDGQHQRGRSVVGGHQYFQHHDTRHYDDGRIRYTGVEPLTGADALRIEGGVPDTEADGVVCTGASRPTCGCCSAAG
jgi:hypothetical protein